MNFDKLFKSEISNGTEYDLISISNFAKFGPNFKFTESLIPIMKSLKCNEFGDMVVIANISRDFMYSPNLADELIYTVGLGGGILPFVFNNPTEDFSNDEYPPNTDVGEGIACFKTRTEEKKNYIILFYREGGYTKNFLFCRRVDASEILSHIVKQNKLRSLELDGNRIDEPILEDGVFSEIKSNSIDFLNMIKGEYSRFKIKTNRGILLYGPPGNGKTLCSRYLKKIANIANYSCTNFNSARIEDAFNEGNLVESINSYDFVFFDDIDISFFTKNGKKSDKESIASTLLNALDGITRNETRGSIRIFTTNENINNIDSAFMRPGRIDKIYFIDKPSKSLISKYIHTFEQEILDNIDVQNFINACDALRLSFAEIEEIKFLCIKNKITNGVWDITASVREFTGNRGSLGDKIDLNGRLSTE